jgi:hypothetical protein
MLFCSAIRTFQASSTELGGLATGSPHSQFIVDRLRIDQIPGVKDVAALARARRAPNCFLLPWLIKSNNKRTRRRPLCFRGRSHLSRVSHLVRPRWREESPFPKRTNVDIICQYSRMLASACHTRGLDQQSKQGCGLFGRNGTMTTPSSQTHSFIYLLMMIHRTVCLCCWTGRNTEAKSWEYLYLSSVEHFDTSHP